MRPCPSPRGESADRVRLIGEAGQASVELAALLPLVVVLGMALWQGVVVAQAAWLAASAARAAARAHAVGRDSLAGARRVLPSRLEHDLRVRSRPDGTVAVTVSVPWVVGAGSATTITEQARFEPQTG